MAVRPTYRRVYIAFQRWRALATLPALKLPPLGAERQQHNRSDRPGKIRRSKKVSLPCAGNTCTLAEEFRAMNVVLPFQIVFT